MDKPDPDEYDDRTILSERPPAPAASFVLLGKTFVDQGPFPNLPNARHYKSKDKSFVLFTPSSGGEPTSVLVGIDKPLSIDIKVHALPLEEALEKIESALRKLVKDADEAKSRE
jgi:hypothetical protein